jgi:excisionase family DNA binding protein
MRNASCPASGGPSSTASLTLAPEPGTTPEAAPPAAGARPLLWDLETTCQQLSIGRRTAERLMSAGKFIKPIKIGRSLRFRPDDVSAWLDEQARGRGAR